MERECRPLFWHVHARPALVRVCPSPWVQFASQLILLLLKQGTSLCTRVTLEGVWCYSLRSKVFFLTFAFQRLRSAWESHIPGSHVERDWVWVVNRVDLLVSLAKEKGMPSPFPLGQKEINQYLCAICWRYSPNPWGFCTQTSSRAVWRVWGYRVSTGRAWDKNFHRQKWPWPRTDGSVGGVSLKLAAGPDIREVASQTLALVNESTFRNLTLSPCSTFSSGKYVYPLSVWGTVIKAGWGDRDGGQCEEENGHLSRQ